MSAQISNIEQSLLKVIRTLPPIRAQQVLEFALFVQNRDLAAGIDDRETEATDDEILVDEAHWDALFATPESEQLMARMVAEVRADIRASRTMPMIITEKDLTPGIDA